jgi:GT2 family glycosyltransferase
VVSASQAANTGVDAANQVAKQITTSTEPADEYSGEAMIKISAIATNLNGKRFLQRLIETLSGQTGVETEIIIVDRESTDQSMEYLAGVPQVKVLSEPALTGLGAGYALGAKHASHDLLFFCNEDMWFDPECLGTLARHIDLESRVGAADPWQWTYDGQRLIHGGVRFAKHSWTPNSPHPRRAFEFTAPLQEGEEIPFACAGAFLIHRRVYDEIGGWDSSFFLEWEDVDLFVRAWQRGWRCVTVPSAKVYHAVGAATAQVARGGRPNSELRYRSGRSNMAAIAIKYFSFSAMVGSVGAALGLTLIAHLLKLQWRRVYLDWMAIGETWSRLPALRRFRRENRENNARKPGERFFTENWDKVRARKAEVAGAVSR